MTTEIPPRPSAPLGMAWAAHYAHQEAVARAAVEALKDTPCPASCGEPTKPFAERVKCPACVALTKIKASGWQP